MMIVYVILRLEITQSSNIKKILYFDLVTCYLNRGNKRADIGYNMNYMKVFE